MKSITVHGIDDELTQLINDKAQQHGKSLNQTIKMLLRQSLSVTSNTAKKRQAAFTDIFGVWSKADEKAFSSKIKGVEHVDHVEKRQKSLEK